MKLLYFVFLKSLLHWYSNGLIFNGLFFACLSLNTCVAFSVLQILDYMEQLPNDKAPRVGTVGEQYRNLQIICQLPKQDLSDVYCEMLQCRNDLTEFRLFCELRDQVAMGVGKVIESSEDAVSRCICLHVLGGLHLDT